MTLFMSTSVVLRALCWIQSLIIAHFEAPLAQRTKRLIADGPMANSQIYNCEWVGSTPPLSPAFPLQCQAALFRTNQLVNVACHIVKPTISTAMRAKC